MKVVSGSAQEEAITIYSHSPILYWWPVWVVGLLMALWTYFDGHHAAFVPQGAAVEGNTIVAPQGSELEAPAVHVARSRWPGVVFVFAVLFAVHLSCASLRGPWGLLGLALLGALILLFNWLHWWDPLFRWFGLLRIHLNLGAYLTVAIPLALMWFAAIYFFDRRTYAVITTGQVRVRDELGASEKVYDTMTVSFEKEPYDWLRFVVGLGAGDVLVRVGGPQPTFYSLPNVIRVGGKMKRIEERLRTRDVI
jgi:hypothetical protein